MQIIKAGLIGRKNVYKIEVRKRITLRFKDGAVIVLHRPVNLSYFKRPG